MKGSDSMGNPLFNLYNNTLARNNGGIQSLLEDFNNFRANFKGDPQETINTLVSQGKVTREQVNEATRIANQLKGLIRW